MIKVIQAFRPVEYKLIDDSCIRYLLKEDKIINNIDHAE